MASKCWYFKNFVLSPGDTLPVVERHRDFAPVIERLVFESRPGSPSSSVRILNCDFEYISALARDLR